MLRVGRGSKSHFALYKQWQTILYPKYCNFNFNPSGLVAKLPYGLLPKFEIHFYVWATDTSTINLVYCFQNILCLHWKAYESMLVSFRVLHLVLIGCYNSDTLSLIAWCARLLALRGYLHSWRSMCMGCWSIVIFIAHVVACLMQQNMLFLRSAEVLSYIAIPVAKTGLTPQLSD